MRIRLVRHGCPVFDAPSRMERLGFAAWLEIYAAAGVVELPGVACGWAADLERSSSVVVSSELRRAKDSACLLGFAGAQASSLLNEARLPHPDALPWNMPWKTALAIYRVAWLLGYRHNAEGIAADRLRAAHAAEWLEALAVRHTEVVAFGHGIMNRLIARSLTASAWRTVESPSGGYWTSQVLVRAAARVQLPE